MVSGQRVRLTCGELYQAGLVGMFRHVQSRLHPDRNHVGSSRFGWGTDIEACCAELAAAKGTGSYWVGSVRPGRKGDLLTKGGQLVEVRHSELAGGCLIVRRGDAEELPFVLVTGIAPTFVLRGWVYGHEAREDRFWREDEEPGAWWVPQDELHALDTLLT